MEHGAEIATGKWSVAECPFEIEYAARVLDDIRLAVVDAFFSLPRGGAEIGGLLLGKFEDERITISGFEPLDCEHATGPSFTLSPRDQILLAKMIAECRRNPADRQPVGWYHSHTRSEIFLSDADRALHNRFFPEPWQVALVLKPHTFEPTRAGFFFREANGALRGDTCYQEFELAPLPLRNGGKPGANRPAEQRPPDENGGPPAAKVETPNPPKERRRVPITREIPLDGVAARAPEAQAGAVDAPRFGELSPGRPWRVLRVAAILVAFLAAGGAGYQTRAYWLPKVLAKMYVVLPHEPDPYLSLAVSDDSGLLKIQWDRNSAAVRNALDATLEISDGNNVPQAVRLDSAHLAAGGFAYARQSERVDVALIASEPGGQLVKEQASFLGRLPAAKPAADDAETAKPKDRGAEVERADKLQKDLNFMAAKTRKLEKDLQDMREQLDRGKQVPEPPIK